MRFYYGVDTYGNFHAFKSKGYRTELIETGVIRPVTYAEYHKVINKPVSMYVMIHDTNDIDTYKFIRVK